METASRLPGPAYEPGTLQPSGAATRERIVAIDLVRGIAMVLMAIDHVRVYAGVPAGGPEPAVFFTRWITHFVAPAFAFLAGTSAFLHGRRLPARAALSRYLLTRGAVLVLLELTVIRVAWTFNLDFQHYMLAGVIWMLGVCMMLMAALVYLPTRAIATAGLAIIALHNMLPGGGGGGGGDGVPWPMRFLYFGGAVSLGPGGPPLFILYVIIPWIGVMMAGHAFGSLMERPVEERRALSLRLGTAAIALFVVLRAVDLYGDPRAWHGMQLPAPLAFIATTKYPASLDFLLMTLGPMLVVLALAERWKGPVARVMETFGRVPFFYYLLHIPLIHAAACLVSLVREGRVNPWLFGNHPLAPPELPDGYRWSLALLYLVFAACVAALYPACRWYAAVRASRRWRWTSYI